MQQQLQGNDREKARQLQQMMNNGQVMSQQQLSAIVPLTEGFLREFTRCIQAQMAASEKNHNLYVTSIQNNCATLNAIIADGSVTPEERLKAIEVLCEMNRNLHMVQMQRAKQEHQFKVILATLGAIVLGVVGFLLGKKGGAR